MTNTCAAHLPMLAGYRCNSCARSWCRRCVKLFEVGRTTMAQCQCGGACVELHLTEADTQSFFARIPSAFLFPLRGAGLFLLVGGVVFFWLLDVVAAVPLVGLIASVIGGGYYLTFLMHTAAETAEGRSEDGPEWPPFDDVWRDAVAPFFRFLFLSIVLGAPAVLALVAGLGKVALLLGLAALLYLPMAFLGLAVFRGIGAASPMLVVPSIRAVPGQYLVACGVMGALVLVAAWATSLASLGLLGAFLARLLGLYLAIVEMRVLGLLYRSNEERLAWTR